MGAGSGKTGRRAHPSCPSLSEADWEEAKALWRKGMLAEHIAPRVGLTEAGFRRIAAEHPSDFPASRDPGKDEAQRRRIAKLSRLGMDARSISRRMAIEEETVRRVLKEGRR